MTPATSRPLANLLANVLDEIGLEPDPECPEGLTPAAVLVVLREPPAEAASPPGPPISHAGKRGHATQAAQRRRTAQATARGPAAPNSPLSDLRVLLTRRRAQLRSHAGEIAFPGGRRDAGDASLQETALREAEEEIGLARDRVLPLGALDVAYTFSTNYAVYPFVALLDDGSEEQLGGAAPAGGGEAKRGRAQSWRVSAREVDAVLELSLGRLEESRGRERLTRRGFTFETDVFTIERDIIWGLTQRILDDLLRRVRLAT
jgi:8-oxo-dGTP pyrophosphatase MutT (NUDIX family)